MKNLLLLLAFFPLLVFAQDEETESSDTESTEETSDDAMMMAEEEEPSLKDSGVPTTYTKDVVGVPVRMKWGVMGQLNPGFTFGMQSDLESDLDSTFTKDYTNNSLGMLLGGNIDIIIGSRLMIGFGGMRLNYNRRIALGKKPADVTIDPDNPPMTPIVSPEEPELGMAHNMWEFMGARLGVLLIHKARYKWNPDLSQYEYSNSFMLYPFAGYHFSGNGTLTVDNYSASVTTFGGVPIQPVTQAEFKATQSLVEVGLGTKWATNPKGGLMFGLELGGYFGMSGTKWEYEGASLENTKAANLVGGYLRVTVGGGFFSLK